MRFYFRTSESTGVGVGPIGLVFVLMGYLVVAMLWVAALVVYVVFKLIVFVVHEVARTRAARS